MCRYLYKKRFNDMYNSDSSFFDELKKYLPTYEEVYLNPDSLRIMNIHWCIFISGFQKGKKTEMK